MRRIKNNSLTRTLALALAVTGAAVLATSCQEDTLTPSGGSANGPDAEGALRVVSVTLDGRELGTTTGAGSRAVYDTYDYVKQSDEKYAWTNTAPLVDKNGNSDDTTFGKYYSNQPNRIITGFTEGDAMKVTCSLGNTPIFAYLQKTNDGWEFRTRSIDDDGNHYDAIGDKLTIRPESSSESWDNFLMAAGTDANEKRDYSYDFPVPCVMNADKLGVGMNTGYAKSSEWKAKYCGENTDTKYNEMQAGRLPSADRVATHPGAFHIGTGDADRGKLTLNLVHQDRALLTLSDDDLTISGWPEGYDAIATLRADQMYNTDTDVNDDSKDDRNNYYKCRPIFSHVREDAAGTKFRWQAIALAKCLGTGNYGDDKDESYAYVADEDETPGTTKAENDANKTYNLRRLHIRLCRKGEDGSIPTDQSKWSEEFIVTLGAEEGIEMRENHRYPLSLTLTPTHQSAAIVNTFPTWTGNEEEMTGDIKG